MLTNIPAHKDVRRRRLKHECFTRRKNALLFATFFLANKRK